MKGKSKFQKFAVNPMQVKQVVDLQSMHYAFIHLFFHSFIHSLIHLVDFPVISTNTECQLILFDGSCHSKIRPVYHSVNPIWFGRFNWNRSIQLGLVNSIGFGQFHWIWSIQLGLVNPIGFNRSICHFQLVSKQSVMMHSLPTHKGRFGEVRRHVHVLRTSLHEKLILLSNKSFNDVF
jgi:hypothetical protein